MSAAPLAARLPVLAATLLPRRDALESTESSRVLMSPSASDLWDSASLCSVSSSASCAGANTGPGVENSPLSPPSARDAGDAAEAAAGDGCSQESAHVPGADAGVGPLDVSPLRATPSPDARDAAWPTPGEPTPRFCDAVHALLEGFFSDDAATPVRPLPGKAAAKSPPTSGLSVMVLSPANAGERTRPCKPTELP